MHFTNQLSFNEFYNEIYKIDVVSRLKKIYMCFK